MHAEPIINPSKKKTSSLLDSVVYPHDLKKFTPEQLPQLCDELRAATIEAVSKTGGHLGASLGVVELTAALHYVFDAPSDKIIWDVGHQAYPHKILTGRKDRIHTLRQGSGLSGFTKRDESVYDPFGAAHSSTSISAGLGMAVARDLAAQKNHVICVIGDGALSAGMAYEALNNAGTQKSKMLVILNDNEMSIAPPVGAMSKYLTNIVSSKSYLSARDKAKSASKFLPSPLRKLAQRAEETARAALGGGTWFEEMGFYYIGPVDGHDVKSLTQLLKNIRESDHDGPILLHTLTRKGHGYLPAEHAPDKMHGVVKFDVITGAQNKTKSNRPSYTKVFAESLICAAKKDEKIIAITAAMPSGTGLDLFADQFPSRCFDVGIAEQHAVTFAGGLACDGYKPFVAIYSTFLQRAYDQIVHDIALQNLPVRFALDRAGLVGADGATHAGAFDIAYLTCLPNMVVMAPGDEAELMHMVATAAAYDDGPIAFRYPRGEGVGLDLPTSPHIIPIGKGRVVSEGQDIAILSYGTRLQSCLDAANICKTKNLNITVADARFAKPLDTDLIKQLLRHHKILITVEEGSQNGFGACVLQFLANEAYLDKGVIVRNLCLPDRFQDHDSYDNQLADAQLDSCAISQKILSLAKLL